MTEIFSVLDFFLSESLDSDLGTQVEHSYDNSELVLDLTVLHLRKTSFHGSSMLVCSGLGGCHWLEVITPISINILSLIHLIWTFSYTFLPNAFHNSHFITGMTSFFLVGYLIHNNI